MFGPSSWPLATARAVGSTSSDFDEVREKEPNTAGILHGHYRTKVGGGNLGGDIGHLTDRTGSIQVFMPYDAPNFGNNDGMVEMEVIAAPQSGTGTSTLPGLTKCDALTDAAALSTSIWGVVDECDKIFHLKVPAVSFQPDRDAIVWKLHLASAPDAVYDALASDEGRASFWAESAAETDGVVHFEFINGERHSGRILAAERPTFWSVDYFGSPVEFRLTGDDNGGTDLELRHIGLPEQARYEVTAGWLNVLLPLKAWVDHGVDLHNRDPGRSWDQGCVDH